eukprot:scaffold102680_cov33-Tisochrysis_lutea.AAC.1
MERCLSALAVLLRRRERNVWRHLGASAGRVPPKARRGNVATPNPLPESRQERKQTDIASLCGEGSVKSIKRQGACGVDRLCARRRRQPRSILWGNAVQNAESMVRWPARVGEGDKGLSSAGRAPQPRQCPRKPPTFGQRGRRNPKMCAVFRGEEWMQSTWWQGGVWR